MDIYCERIIADVIRGYPFIVGDGDINLLVFTAENSEAEFLKEVTSSLTKSTDILLTDKRASALVVERLPQGLYTIPHSLANKKSLDDNKMHIADFRKQNAQIYKQIVILLKHAELLPAALIVQIDEVEKESLINKYKILSTNIKQLQEYSKKVNLQFECFVEAPLTLYNAQEAKIIGYRSRNNGKTHYAIIVGELGRTPLLRMHSSCFTGDLLGSLKCDCGQQLQNSLKYMAAHGGGVVIYLSQEGRGIGLASKLRTYGLQSKGLDTVEANEFLGYENDERSFLPAYKIMQDLQISRLRLISNNPRKADDLKSNGFIVEEMVHLQSEINSHNIDYLKTKATKSNHKINLKKD